jgi:hypothetical protein
VQRRVKVQESKHIGHDGRHRIFTTSFSSRLCPCPVFVVSSGITADIRADIRAAGRRDRRICARAWSRNAMDSYESSPPFTACLRRRTSPSQKRTLAAHAEQQSPLTLLEGIAGTAAGDAGAAPEPAEPAAEGAAAAKEEEEEETPAAEAARLVW